jgi:hypothetical protein
MTNPGNENATSGSCPPVPQELVDRIIDLLRSDKRALKSCGLVSTKWLSRSRRHLFWKAKLHHRNKSAFYNLIKSSHVTIAPFIRWLDWDLEALNGENDTDKECLEEESLAQNESVNAGLNETGSSEDEERFIMGYLGIHAPIVALYVSQHLTPSTQALIVQGFEAVTELHLFCIKLGTFQDVMELVSSFPLLEYLELNSECDDDDDELDGSSPILTLYPIPTRLRILSLGWFQPDKTLRWLLSSQVAPPISRLELNVVYMLQPTIASLAEFLNAVGPNLALFSVFIPEDDYVSPTALGESQVVSSLVYL